MNRATHKLNALVIGIWTVVALITMAHYVLMYQMEDRPYDWLNGLAMNFAQWYLWAAATPLVVWLARRIPIERPRVGRALALHAGACIAIALVQTAYIAQIALWTWTGGGEVWPYWKMFLGMTYTLHLHVLIYGAIVGVTYAYDNYTRATRLESQLASAQLEALRAQLQPHFLFNTLHGIAGLIRNGQNAAATNMIAGLSDLLRASLDNSGKQEVSLEEELEFVGRYLDIQRMRFSDRLTVEVDAAADTFDALVPNLVLQPLVENALRHGVSQRAAAGSLTIRARREDGWLHLSVLDDGPGLAKSTPDGNGSGIGLSNTRARLAQLYGDAFRFDVHDRATGGVEAMLAIPLRTI